MFTKAGKSRVLKIRQLESGEKRYLREIIFGLPPHDPGLFSKLPRLLQITHKHINRQKRSQEKSE